MLNLDPMVWTVLALVLFAAVLLTIIGIIRRRRRTGRLRERFGPEYERTAEQAGSRRRAEADLEDRLELHQALDIRDLEVPVRRRYTESWRRLQLHFVDNPADAVRDAGRLVDDLMQERGYVFGDFEKRAAALSVDYPHLAGRYRDAQTLALDPDEHPPRTEELRQVLLDYRLILEELIDGPLVQEEQPGQVKS
ncbi:MAG: hypothetical protein ACRDXD_10945 [Acidimicrobiia bacterium]